MKKFITRLLFFSLPILAGAIGLLFLPYSRKFAYNYAAKDCESSNFIHQRLFESEKPVEVALIGSSRTICGIDDRLLDSLLCGARGTVANVAMCRQGRNSQYIVLKDLLLRKKPSLVVIEVYERESRSSHLDFPYIAYNEDLLAPKTIYNSNYFTDIAGGIRAHHLHLQENILGTHRDSMPNPERAGFSHITGGISITEQQAAEMNARRAPAGTPGGNVKQRAEWRYSLNRTWLKDMVEIASQHNCRVVLLYVPSYTNRDAVPADMELYQSLAPVLLPPGGYLDEPAMWRDEQHLNYGGTQWLTRWLADQMREKKYF